jgi:hypothetical protein
MTQNTKDKKTKGQKDTNTNRHKEDREFKSQSTWPLSPEKTSLSQVILNKKI